LDFNQGVSAALNGGIRRSKGKYISWLSHDDIYHEEKISRQINFLNSLPDTNVVVYSKFELLNSSPKKSHQKITKLLPPEYFRYWLVKESNLHGCTLLIPKAAFEIHGYFNESLKTIQDTDMWMRISSSFKFYGMVDYLVLFRIHKDQDSLTKKAIVMEERNLFFEKAILELQGHEIILGSNGSLLKGYADLIFSLKSRKFLKAEKKVLSHFGIVFNLYYTFYCLPKFFNLVRGRAYGKLKYTLRTLLKLEAKDN
jgi:glycosyltransferase involved in cell wall biosynthesis